MIVRTAAAVLAFAFAARAARPSDDPILRIEVGMHTSHVTRIGIDRGGRSLLSASDDKTARLWDVRTGELLRVLRPPIAAGPEGKLYAAALSADGTVAAVAGWTELGSESGHTIYLFESRTGALLRRIGGLPNCVMSLAFSIDGSRLAAGLGSQGIRVFHQADGALLFADEDYKGDVYGLDFDAAGRLATTSYDGAVRLYDEAGRRIAKRVAPHGARPLGVAFSPDGVSLAVGYSDVAAVDVLSAADLQPKFSADTSNVKRPLAIVGWSADGETLAAGGTHPTEGTKRIRLFRSGGRGAPIDVDAASGTVKDIKATPDGGFVFGAADPLLGVLNANGARRVLRDSPLADHRGRALRASQDGLGSIDGHDALAEPARLDRQIPLAAAEIGDFKRGEQMSKRAGPRRPASARHDLAPFCGRAVLVEVLFSNAADLFQPRIVRASVRRLARSVEMRAQERPQGAEPVGAGLQRPRQTEERESSLTALFDQPRVLHQAEMPRYAGLRDPEDRGQLRHVQPLGVQQAQHPEPDLVAKQAQQRSGLDHIYKSTCVDGYLSSTGDAARSPPSAILGRPIGRDRTFPLLGPGS